MTEGWQHIEINGHGTIVVLRLISDEGRSWFEDNVRDPVPGGIYTCEPRMAQDILQVAARDLCLGKERPPHSRRGGGQQITIVQPGSL